MFSMNSLPDEFVKQVYNEYVIMVLATIPQGINSNMQNQSQLVLFVCSQTVVHRARDVALGFTSWIFESTSDCSSTCSSVEQQQPINSNCPVCLSEPSSGVTGNAAKWGVLLEEGFVNTTILTFNVYYSIYIILSSIHPSNTLTSSNRDMLGFFYTSVQLYSESNSFTSIKQTRFLIKSLTRS